MFFKSTTHRSASHTATKTRSLRLIAGLCASMTLLGSAGCTSDSSAHSTNSSQTTIAEQSMTDARRQSHIESFNYVWESIQSKHWDPNLNGADWDQAKADLLPIVENAQTDNEARSAMMQLLNRLGQSHFAIIPSVAYERLEAESDNSDDDTVTTSDPDAGPGWSGMRVRLVGDQFYITHVADNSPASRAGIKTGWIVEKLRGRDMSSVVEVSKEVEGVNRPETQAGLIAYSRLNGSAGDTISMTLADDKLDSRDFTITLDPSPGEIGSIGELPPSPVEIESATLANGIGYFRLSVFLSPGKVLPEFQRFIKEHKDAPGIVIDMRGNFGGIILMAPGMINWVIDEKGLTLGTMKMRDPARGPFDIPLMLNPRSKSYTGKVAVLTDEMSISNAEILAAGLKDIGRGKLFGKRTAGLVLPSTVERLPNGDGFQYAFASYTTGGGYTLEGVGAIPDVEIEYTRQGLLNGEDEVLDAATDWILEQE